MPRLIGRIVLLACVAVVLPRPAPAQTPASSVIGVWEWRGAAGWQRIVLELEAGEDGLAGRIVMGPGGTAPRSPDQFWEYFFEPVAFRLRAVSLEGVTIRFEHFIGGDEERLRYIGEVDGERMTLMREAPGTAGMPDDSGAHGVAFTLERAR
jgi:hypothetical protein